MANASKDKGILNRKVFLESLENNGKVADALIAPGVTRSAYEKWRQRFPDFAAKADAIRLNFHTEKPDTEIPAFEHSCQASLE